jgi:hypothetical protein
VLIALLERLRRRVKRPLVVTLIFSSEAALVAFLALPHPQHQTPPRRSHSYAILGVALVLCDSMCVLL